MTPESRQNTEAATPSPSSSASSVIDSVNQDAQSPENTGRDPASEDSDSSVGSIPSYFPDNDTVPLQRKGRKSLLFTTKRGRGVEMDAATKEANTLLLNGKEALDQATNIKKELKTTALESMQAVYEIVLSISDSRSRHKNNLEKDRSRHAQELARLERAHSKSLEEITAEMRSTRETLATNLKETTNIRKWLEFETRDPHIQIKDSQTDERDSQQSNKTH
ncbi:unnamed protein product [Danaus chrysippus]|uniref:(African queen) hypothetical protein n=1 Tax=Danaus chrysippus TaxID=151541 RepID=A0A8J2QMG4_9NEOP|nr:unnamed protein product [Danaus chrysippus]